MQKGLKKIWLSREALLFDSPLYILKGFASILTAYLLFNTHPIIGKDMISVLFGMMLTLEPITVSGIKSGFDQIKATLLGGVVSLIIISIFGINAITIALSVALTMYFALVMNWRFVSPVAIFTAIYMTQFVQLDAQGAQSYLLTFRLRMLALGAGIAIAIIYNYVFSLFFYKGMLKKRLTYLVEGLDQLVECFETEDPKTLKARAIALLSDIDTLANQIHAMRGQEEYKENVSSIRDMTHLYLHLVMKKTEDL